MNPFGDGCIRSASQYRSCHGSAYVYDPGKRTILSVLLTDKSSHATVADLTKRSSTNGSGHCSRWDRGWRVKAEGIYVYMRVVFAKVVRV